MGRKKNETTPAPVAATPSPAPATKPVVTPKKKGTPKAAKPKPGNSTK